VKTTPKPNATKNRSGELVGPGLPPPWELGLDVGEEVDVGVDIAMIYFLSLPFCLMEVAFATKRSTTVCCLACKKGCRQDRMKTVLAFPPPLPIPSLGGLEHWIVTDTLDGAA
jgi:hypothetical protein